MYPAMGCHEYHELATKIYEAIKMEHTDGMYYDQLAEKAPTDEARQIIKNMARDEHCHAHTLEMVYKELTGMNPPPEPQPPQVGEYTEALRQRLKAETDAVEFYRELYLATHNYYLRDTFFRIMNDEIEHALRLIYLLTF